MSGKAAKVIDRKKLVRISMGELDDLFADAALFMAALSKIEATAPHNNIHKTMTENIKSDVLRSEWKWHRRHARYLYKKGMGL